MNMTWLQSILLGIVTGFADILPVSAQAHRLLLLKLFGVSSEPAILRLLLHLGTLGALYSCCRGQIIRISRARKLARIPKRRRKRPLDTKVLMDFSLLKTTLIPIVFAFLFYSRAYSLGSNLLIVAIFLFLNGLILYIPQFLPGSNKNSGNATRVEGLLMGIGGGLSTLPGISCVGAVTSIGCICGMDRDYSVSTALMMNIAVTICLIVYDVLALLSEGLAGLTFQTFIGFLLAAGAAFLSVFFAAKLLKKITVSVGMSVFGFYSWGLALFTFILYLAV